MKNHINKEIIENYTLKDYNIKLVSRKLYFDPVVYIYYVIVSSELFNEYTKYEFIYLKDARDKYLHIIEAIEDAYSEI